MSHILRNFLFFLSFSCFFSTNLMASQEENSIFYSEQEALDKNMDLDLTKTHLEEELQKRAKLRRNPHSWYLENLPEHFLDGVIIMLTTLSITLGYSPEMTDFLIGWFLAELITGHVHWWEDTYDPDHNHGYETLKGKITTLYQDAILCPNRDHHEYPREIIENSPFESLKASALASVIPFTLFSGFEYLGLFSVPSFVYVALVSGGLANEIHKLAHHTPDEMKKISFMIYLLQKIGFMQSAAHHKRHHYSEDRGEHYLVMSNYLNPVLESSNYWRKLERFLKWASRGKLNPKKRGREGDEASYKKHCSDRDPQVWLSRSQP